MTDTLSHPPVVANRRHFLGGAMGLAGMLGLGNIKHVSADEATAAATAAADYVWTPPQYDPEPSLFTVLDRNDETVIVETIDGQIGVPANPTRIVALGYEYVALFELGVIDRLVALAYSSYAKTPLMNAGDMTEAMHAALANVALIPDPWEPDLELVAAQHPDLILASAQFTPDPTALAQIAPVIRLPALSINVPRAAVRDFGALFGLGDVEAAMTADHEAFIERARQAVEPVVGGKKAVVISLVDDGLMAPPSYYLVNGEVFAYVEGAYQLHRELRISPSNFIEALADEADRSPITVKFSPELVGEVDADYIFVYDFEHNYDLFVSDPLVKQTAAAKQGQIYPYDAVGFGAGLAGDRATVAWMVETLTGKPFAGSTSLPAS
ncbi:MAG: ABC transporter substrate-binding protein [Thermomicrobiales bacterium]